MSGAPPAPRPPGTGLSTRSGQAVAADSDSRAAMSKAARGRASRSDVGPHRREPRGVVEQAVDLVGEHRQVVAADRRPFLQQVVGVPLLLAGDRVDDHEDEAAGQGLGGGQAARACRRRGRTRPCTRPSRSVKPTTLSVTAELGAASPGACDVELGLAAPRSARRSPRPGPGARARRATSSASSIGPTPNPPAETRIVVRSGSRPCFSRISALSFGSAKTGSIGMPDDGDLSRPGRPAPPGGRGSRRSRRSSARSGGRATCAWTSKSVTTIACRVASFSFDFSHEMISAGRKCVQIAISGWYGSSSLTNGRVLSLSNASLPALVLPGLVEVVVEPAEDLRRPVDHLDVRLGVEACGRAGWCTRACRRCGPPRRPRSRRRRARSPARPGGGPPRRTPTGSRLGRASSPSPRAAVVKGPGD